MVAEMVGRTVNGIGRILYEYRGEVDRADGALELRLDDQIVLLDSAAGGECLRVRTGAWRDPFAEPLAPENQRFVERHGRWVRIDCYKEEPYADFVGSQVAEASLLKNEWGHVAGIRFAVHSRCLWFVVEGDECHVYWAHPIGFREVRAVTRL
ncbi:MAG: hypothetical protein U0271_35215 [Polyangiaceae bacterium]